MYIGHSIKLQNSKGKTSVLQTDPEHSGEFANTLVIVMEKLFERWEKENSVLAKGRQLH